MNIQDTKSINFQRQCDTVEGHSTEIRPFASQIHLSSMRQAVGFPVPVHHSPMNPDLGIPAVLGIWAQARRCWSSCTASRGTEILYGSGW